MCSPRRAAQNAGRSFRGPKPVLSVSLQFLVRSGKEGSRPLVNHDHTDAALVHLHKRYVSFDGDFAGDTAHIEAFRRLMEWPLAWVVVERAMTQNSTGISRVFPLRKPNTL